MSHAHLSVLTRWNGDTLPQLSVTTITNAILHFRDSLRNAIALNIQGSSRRVSPRVRSCLGIEWEGLVASREAEERRRNALRCRKSSGCSQSTVGRSSLVSAIVSQDCDVRAALRNARTHLIRGWLAGWLAAHQDLYRIQKCVGYRCSRCSE